MLGDRGHACLRDISLEPRDRGGFGSVSSFTGMTPGMEVAPELRGSGGSPPTVPASSDPGAARHLAVRVAEVKSMLPLPPPTSMRILASSMFPSVRPALAHALKCSEMEICPHWRAV